MKHIAVLFALFAMIYVDSIAQNTMANNIDNSNIALQGYSPVSYSELGLAQKGVQSFNAKHNDIIYYFTSADQKAKFEKNPNNTCLNMEDSVLLGFMQEQSFDRIQTNLL